MSSSEDSLKLFLSESFLLYDMNEFDDDFNDDDFNVPFDDNFDDNFDGWLEDAIDHVRIHNFGGEVEEIDIEEINEWFNKLGLDGDTTEAVTLVGNTRYWSSPHEWDQTLPHDWTEDELLRCDDPFYGEEWMRYDPSEGF